MNASLTGAVEIPFTGLTSGNWIEDIRDHMEFDLDSFPVDANGEFPVSNPNGKMVASLSSRWGIPNEHNKLDFSVEAFYSKVTRQGRLFRTHMSFLFRAGGGKRGSVLGFSTASRARLMMSFSKVRLVGGHFWFLTLTFPPDAPCFGKYAKKTGAYSEGESYPYRNPLSIGPFQKEEFTGPWAIGSGTHGQYEKKRFELAKKVLKNFFDQIRRMGFSGLWVLEKTRAGVPHFHVVLKHEEEFPLGDYFSFDPEFYDRKTDGKPWPGFVDYSRKWSMKRFEAKGEIKHEYKSHRAIPRKGGNAGLRVAVQKIWAGSVNLGVKPRWLSGDNLAIFRKSFVAGVDVQELKDPSRIAGYFSKYMAKNQDDNRKGYQKDGLTGRVWGVFGRANFFEQATDIWISNRLLPELRRLMGACVLAVYGKEHKGDSYRKSWIAFNNDKLTAHWLLSNAEAAITTEANYIKENCRKIVKDCFKLRPGKKIAFLPELYRQHFPEFMLLTGSEPPF